MLLQHCLYLQYVKLISKMIVGIGTDIVNIERIGSIFDKYGDAFLKKNFHHLEIQKHSLLSGDKKLPYLAKRFAAKEAIAKAFGQGIGSMIAFCDIAIINNDFGTPQVIISFKKIPDIAKYDIQISLSDDHPFAVAFVVISK